MSFDHSSHYLRRKTDAEIFEAAERLAYQRGTEGIGIETTWLNCIGQASWDMGRSEWERLERSGQLNMAKLRTVLRVHWQRGLRDAGKTDPDSAKNAVTKELRDLRRACVAVMAPIQWAMYDVAATKDNQAKGGRP